ncbi:MAG: class I SAM-dependent methyltransferase [Pseudomonadota bacterium]
MTDTNAIWDRVAERYARKPVPDEDVYRKKLSITQGYFTPDMDVFEFGCGTGTTAVIHAPFVRHLRAIDVSAKMLEIAENRAAKAGVDNVTFEQAAIDDFEAADESYDVVLGLSILHLVADKEAIIAKVRNMLKPGGVFVSSTACLGDKLWFFKYIEPIGRRLGLMPMVKVFTVKELEDSLTDAGFEIDHHWVPNKGHTAFFVAKKAG